MAYKPANPLTQANGYPILEGWFAEFGTATAEQSVQSLQDGWCGPKQRAFNAAHTTCGRCHGRGYTRRDGKMSCSECGGTGSVPN